MYVKIFMPALPVSMSKAKCACVCNTKATKLNQVESHRSGREEEADMHLLGGRPDCSLHVPFINFLR